MRKIRTIILRLLVDTEQPESLRGILNAMPDDHVHPFTDEGSLLAQLHHIIQTQNASPGEAEQDGNGFKVSHQA